jgi:hypothetical protein
LTALFATPELQSVWFTAAILHRPLSTEADAPAETKNREKRVGLDHLAIRPSRASAAAD